MKNLFLYIVLLLPMFVFSQNEQLAQNYFDRGEFDKATLIYEDLIKAQPNNYNYFQKQVTCFQQLKQFDKAETIIKNRIEKTKQPNLYIELGIIISCKKTPIKPIKTTELPSKK